ncbi:MAG: exodeoxyribonuclease V subunit gamma [Proteobacteria bacterium]|nr:exodeoxyribonuclease V subunit gamma [Pseudomonadota bacterium]HQR03215.1 exodeoxyribonuclease V subunit gamma [Rhodocyclaceae bacterium]
MFRLIHGNHQEALARSLAHTLRTRPPGLFETEVIVVQSGAMERWLRLTLAEELGIAAQIEFPFPAGYLWTLYGRVLPAVPKSSPLAAESLHWRFLRLLSQPRDGVLWTPLRHYLQESDALRRDGLARKLAATFETYLAYRPDWIEAWRGGRLCGLGSHEAWQAALWRELLAELRELPEAHPAQAFLDALDADPALIQHLPRRISLFGIGTMAPPHFEVFRRLGDHTEVTLYLLNPCREYWGDIVARRIKARAALEDPAAALVLDTGHSLLGSLGVVAREFFDRASDSAEIGEVFIDPAERGAPSLLQRLQSDLLNLHEPESPSATPDGSLQIHVCHSAMREVEVLHDQLLARFAADTTLRPADVLVLAPDITRYAPLVEAWFATQPASRYIPFTIADCPPTTQAPLQRAFTALLDLAGGRLEATAVLAFIGQPPVARRLGLDEREVERVRDWIRSAGIRWGVDADWRSARGLPAQSGHSWRNGFERLLLGLALPTDVPRLFAGCLPASDITGAEARLLGRLIDFCETLFRIHRDLEQTQTLAEWAALLPRMLELLFDEGHDSADVLTAQALRSAADAIADTARAADCAEAVPLTVWRRSLDEALEGRAPGWAFLGGGVTFASLRAHRAVPARIVCVLGLDDGEFPRNPALPGFDLLVGHPRAGDRTARDEDRHAFLDALLSARDGLYLSYRGRSIRDNAVLPSSTLFGELKDSLARGYIAPGALTVEHPLQPFSHHYFDGTPGPVSYVEEYAAASRALSHRSIQGFREASPFLAAPLPSEPGLAANVSLDELVGFLHNPARQLLRNRLGIHLDADEGPEDDAEPFILDKLDQFWLDDFILDHHEQGEAAVRALARARGDLPHGCAGDILFRTRWNAVDEFARRVAVARAGHGDALPVEWMHGGTTLTGQLTRAGSEGFATWRAGKTRMKDRLGLWVHHLVLHLVAPAGVPRISRLLCLDGETRFGPVPDAPEILARLLALWRRGQQELLPFFPETSGACAAGRNWQKSWRDDHDPQRGESGNPYFGLAFGKLEFFDERFHEIAGAVFVPLIAAMETTP